MIQGDWRLTNQENYLKDKRLRYLKYRKEDFGDHEHCSFCWEKFDSNEQMAYCTCDYRHWICSDCYEDFKGSFKWELITKESTDF